MTNFFRSLNFENIDNIELSDLWHNGEDCNNYLPDLASFLSKQKKLLELKIQGVRANFQRSKLKPLSSLKKLYIYNDEDLTDNVLVLPIPLLFNLIFLEVDAYFVDSNFFNILAKNINIYVNEIFLTFREIMNNDDGKNMQYYLIKEFFTQCLFHKAHDYDS